MSSYSNKRCWRATALVSSLLACSTAACAPAFAASGENLVTNPGAETGNLEGWTGSGFGVARYGSSPNVSSQAFASYNGLGSWLFRGEQTGSTLTQVVPLSDLAGTIDAGQQPLSINAVLGGAGSGPDGMELSMQPQGASGEPLGPPVQLGPPTAADREDRATFVRCYATVTAPAGTRSALITLLAVGNPGAATTAIADNVELIDVELATEAILWPGPPIQGPHCHNRLLLPPEPKSSGPPSQPSGPSPCANSERTLGAVAVVATAPSPATTPAATPPPTPPNSCDTMQEAVSVSHIRLTRGKLSLRMSGAGTIGVAIARENLVATHARHSTRSTWRAIMHFTLHAKSAGIVSRSLHRLKVGRYRITANVVGSARPVTVTIRIGR
jgi:hypothetical protein